MGKVGLSVRSNVSTTGAIVVNFRCPACLHNGAFNGVANIQDARWGQPMEQEEIDKNIESEMFAGIRICPNPECNAPVFVILRNRELFKAFPPEVIDFDATKIPPTIQQSMEEAIKCHSNECYRASALMVRRMLEEICADREASGDNLQARIKALRSTVIIPDELLQAADELRILGNDAAHVEAKIYDKIGKEEAEIAVELGKELLKAVYQYSALVERLRALKEK